MVAVTGSSRKCTVTVSPLVVASATIRGSAPEARIEHSPLGTCLSHRSAHERVEQPFENDLTGYCLRHLDHGCEIEMFDRRPDRTGRNARWVCRPEVRIHLIELPHLAVRPPTDIAVSRVAQIGVRDLLEPASA